jgi:hypothetical protein
MALDFRCRRSAERKIANKIRKANSTEKCNRTKETGVINRAVDNRNGNESRATNET